MVYGLRENSKKSFRLANPEFLQLMLALKLTLINSRWFKTKRVRSSLGNQLANNEAHDEDPFSGEAHDKDSLVVKLVMVRSWRCSMPMPREAMVTWYRVSANTRYPTQHFGKPTPIYNTDPIQIGLDNFDSASGQKSDYVTFWDFPTVIVIFQLISIYILIWKCY